ncbi:MAG TPA: IgGFc-binding protein, partial [Polyangiales bacterium]|nr:IgGFc-binding protein [Polyangiales bacterium]
MRARSSIPLWMLASLLLVTRCSCGDDETDDKPAADGGGGDSGLAPFECEAGTVQCDGSRARVCDGKGGFKAARNCADDGQRCMSSRLSSTGRLLTLGCVACTPGEASCSGGKARICREDGSGYYDFDCDAAQGMTCEANGCKGACAPPEVTSSYIGCDYYPTVTLNPVWSGFDFAVAVSNASDAPAKVIVTRGDDTVRELSVPVSGLEIVKLPWVSGLKGGDQNACQVPPDPGDSRVVKQGAYRLRSDRPVTVYQLSPLQYELGKGEAPPAMCPVGTKCPGGVVPECLSYSNDASLLLPATTLSGDYTVMSWQSRGNTASFFAVTATADGTRVTLSGRGGFRPGGGVDRDGKGEVLLDRGDVLEVVANHGDANDDASGTRVHADKPVQVIAGHSCANVPTGDTPACDHLEQALFPLQILGTEYVASYPAAVASQSPHVLRIAAVQANTKVRFDPALQEPITLGPDDEPFELRIGNYVRGGEDQAPVDVRVTSDKPILIAQYMQGQGSVPSGAGDPSMSLVVPIAQYRREYIFTASTTYDANFINVTTKLGAQVMLDGELLSGDSRDVGASDYKVIRARLPAAGSGVHRISSDEPFGLVV